MVVEMLALELSYFGINNKLFADVLDIIFSEILWKNERECIIKVFFKIIPCRCKQSLLNWSIFVERVVGIKNLYLKDVDII